MMSPEYLNRMRNCCHFLEQPAPGVVNELLDEIDEMRMQLKPLGKRIFLDMIKEISTSSSFSVADILQAMKAVEVMHGIVDEV